MKGYSKEIRERAIQMHKDGCWLKDISKELGPARRTISNWIYGIEGRIYSDPADLIRVPSEVLAERAYRRSLEPRDITAALFGDPLPGYSALERR